MTENRYYIVEYRIPYDIMEATSVDDAVYKAKKEFEVEFGFIPSSWYCRVYVYENDEKKVGPTEEHFFNPSGESHRELRANFKKHEDRIEREKNE